MPNREHSAKLRWTTMENPFRQLETNKQMEIRECSICLQDIETHQKQNGTNVRKMENT